MLRWGIWVFVSAAWLCSSAILIAQDAQLDAVIEQTIVGRAAIPGIPFYYHVAGRTLDDEIGGVIYLQLRAVESDETLPGIVEIMVVLKQNGTWAAWLPGDANYSAMFDSLPPSVMRRFDSTPYKPAPDIIPSMILNDYQFPWADGQWGTVTRSFGAHGRGQIDFDISGLDVTATKDGTIIYANDTHQLSAYNTGSWWYWNVVIIHHSERQYSLYGHIAPGSLPQWIKDECSDDYSAANCEIPVKAGDVIAQEGSTGYSSAQHLHIEFGQQYGIVAYPDLLDEDGDGDRYELTYAGHVFAEQNIAFQGYTPAEVAAWPYGTLNQASHREIAPADQNIVRNGDFAQGTGEWQPSGQLSWAVESETLRFMRLNTTEPPDWAIFYQDLNYGAPANTPFEVTLDLGNNSGNAKTVSVSLRNSAGWDYGFFQCHFSIPANTPLQHYTIQGKTVTTWANIRLLIGVNPPDSAFGALADHITVMHRPDLDVVETQCGQAAG